MTSFSKLHLLATVAASMLLLSKDEEAEIEARDNKASTPKKCPSNSVCHIDRMHSPTTSGTRNNNNNDDDKENTSPGGSSGPGAREACRKQDTVEETAFRSTEKEPASLAFHSSSSTSESSAHSFKQDDSWSDEEEEKEEEDTNTDDSLSVVSASPDHHKTVQRCNKNKKETSPNRSSSYEYWMQRDWVPSIQKRNTKGHLVSVQKSPDDIRQELLQFLQTQKKKKTALLLDLGVNSNSFRKFMDASNYKDPWRAIENGTYWAAARYLEAERVDPNRTQTSVVIPNFFPPISRIAPLWRGDSKSSKRPPSSATTGSHACKRHKKSYREDAIHWMRHIVRTPCDATEDRIYETLPYIVQQIQSILARPGVSKTSFCDIALQGLNRKSLDKLLNTYHLHGQSHVHSNLTYARAWVFIEQKRIYDGQDKSQERRQTEMEHPEGLTILPNAAYFESIVHRACRGRKNQRFGDVCL